MTATDPLHHAEPTDSPYNAWRAGYRHGWNDLYNRVGHRKETANPYPEAGIVVGAEDWGIVMDALIRERDHATERKAINSESASNLRVEACNRMILAIAEAHSRTQADEPHSIRSTQPETNGQST